jgi:hypothetical protein
MRRLTFGKDLSNKAEGIGALSYWGGNLTVQMGFRKLGNVAKLDGTALYHFNVGKNDSTQLWRSTFASVQNSNITIYGSINVAQNNLKTIAQLQEIVNSDEGKTNRLLMAYTGTTPGSNVNVVIMQIPTNAIAPTHPGATAVNAIFDKPNTTRANYFLDFWSHFEPGAPAPHNEAIALASIYKNPATQVPYASIGEIPIGNIIAIKGSSTSSYVNVGPDIALTTPIAAKQLPEVVNYFPEVQYDGANFIGREMMWTDKEYFPNTCACSKLTAKAWPDYKLEVHFENVGQKYGLQRVYGIPIEYYRLLSEVDLSKTDLNKRLYDFVFRMLYPANLLNSDGAIERLSMGQLLPLFDSVFVKLWSSIDKVALPASLGQLESHMVDAQGLPQTFTSTQAGQNCVIGKFFTPPKSWPLNESEFGANSPNGNRPYEFKIVIGYNTDALDKNHVSIIMIEPSP